MRKITYCIVGNVTYFDNGMHLYNYEGAVYAQRMREKGHIVLYNENIK